MFDADIFGPSQPRMLGVSGARPEATEAKRIIPIEAYGVKVMSIGFLVPEEQPVVWRGLMVMGALEQLMRDVEWGTLDVLVVDMPPGTGDTQLTMTQRVPLAGAVIVLKRRRTLRCWMPAQATSTCSARSRFPCSGSSRI